MLDWWLIHFLFHHFSSFNYEIYSLKGTSSLLYQIGGEKNIFLIFGEVIIFDSLGNAIRIVGYFENAEGIFKELVHDDKSLGIIWICIWVIIVFDWINYKISKIFCFFFHRITHRCFCLATLLIEISNIIIHNKVIIPF